MVFHFCSGRVALLVSGTFWDTKQEMQKEKKQITEQSNKGSIQAHIMNER